MACNKSRKTQKRKSMGKKKLSLNASKRTGNVGVPLKNIVAPI